MFIHSKPHLIVSISVSINYLEFPFTLTSFLFFSRIALVFSFSFLPFLPFCYICFLFPAISVSHLARLSCNLHQTWAFRSPKTTLSFSPFSLGSRRARACFEVPNLSFPSQKNIFWAHQSTNASPAGRIQSKTGNSVHHEKVVKSYRLLGSRDDILAHTCIQQNWAVSAQWLANHRYAKGTCGLASISPRFPLTYRTLLCVLTLLCTSNGLWTLTRELLLLYWRTSSLLYPFRTCCSTCPRCHECGRKYEGSKNPQAHINATLMGLCMHLVKKIWAWFLENPEVRCKQTPFHHSCSTLRSTLLYFSFNLRRKLLFYFANYDHATCHTHTKQGKRVDSWDCLP